MNDTIENIAEQALNAMHKDPRAAAGLLVGIAWQIINSNHGAELADYWLFETTLKGIRERQAQKDNTTQH